MLRVKRNLLAQVMLASGLCLTAASVFADEAVVAAVEPAVASVPAATAVVADEATAQSTVVVNAPAKAKEDMTLLERLQPFLINEDPLIRYQAEKAKAWLNYAAAERSERSLSKAKKEALQQANDIVEKLEKSEDISTTTPILSVSKVMRRDLWVTAELLKQHPGFSCAATDIAQAEVMLVWAAAEHCELGWHHSREPFNAAERLIDKASYEAFSCHDDAPKVLPKVDYPSMESLNGTQSGCHGVVGNWPIIGQPKVEAVVVEPVVEPVTAPVVVEPVAAVAVIPNSIHFALNQSSLSDTSKQVLNDIVASLKANPDYSVTLYGYTDQRASVAYNLALSKRRAQAIQTYIVAQGIVAGRIAVVAEGKKSVITDQDALMGHALSRRVELVYAMADGKEVTSLPQRADVQIER